MFSSGSRRPARLQPQPLQYFPDQVYKIIPFVKPLDGSGGIRNDSRAFHFMLQIIHNSLS